MRLKFPFDVKYRPQIESGEYKVEIGRDDPWPARIVCWDFDGNNLIVAVRNPNDREEGLIYSIDGKHKAICPKIDSDLFIITPEPELTELEKAVKDLCWKVGMGEVVYKGDIIKKIAAELLDLARNQLQKEGLVTMEHMNKACEAEYQSGLADGKNEALTDLPRWKPAARAYDGDRLPRIDWSLNRIVDRFEDGIFYLDMSELSKLPGFKEAKK